MKLPYHDLFLKHRVLTLAHFRQELGLDYTVIDDNERSWDDYDCLIKASAFRFNLSIPIGTDTSDTLHRLAESIYELRDNLHGFVAFRAFTDNSEVACTDARDAIFLKMKYGAFEFDV